MSERLPRSTPAAEGVDAKGILAFLDAVAATATDLHSLMILRHGSVVAEGWWAPYRRDDIQLLYSLSKTFTAMAVGIAVGEGRLSVDDLVADLLPDDVPQPRPPHLDQLRVRHLLSMASGHRDDTIFQLARAGGDPVRGFLALPPDQPPGTLFAYNQGNPIALSAIITALTGQRLLDYLRPRLLAPLGIEDAEWLALSPSLDQGFSGLHATTEAVATLGQLVLQHGSWHGEQLVPAAFVDACRRSHIDNSTNDAPDWQQGYGYLMWMCRHGAQRGDGAYGQLAVVLPEQDAVVACTAEVVDMQAELDLVWRHLLPALDGAHPADADADDELCRRLDDLSTPTITATATGPEEVVTLEPAPAPGRHTHSVDRVRVEPLRGGTRLVLGIAGDEHSFDVRPGQWTDGELPGRHSPFPAASATGGWVSPTELHVDIVARRTPHRLQLRASTTTGTVDIDWRFPVLPIPTFPAP
jgi:CubicO group peptidase (beta-lactamase class C family)